MRIAVVNWSCRRVGGIEDYLAAIVPALQNAGHAVSFWYEVDAPTDRELIQFPSEIKVSRLPERGEAGIEELRKWAPDVTYAHAVESVSLERQIVEVRPSVLFVHGYYATCISGNKTYQQPGVMPCSREFGWPCLVQYYPRRCGGWSPVTMWREYQKQTSRVELLHRYDTVVTHSGHMVAEMARHGVSATQIPFAVQGRSPGAHVHDPRVLRLSFVGRMDHLKGGHLLLEAIPHVVREMKRPLRVSFIGDGPELERWQRLARAASLQMPEVEIQFTGWLSAPDVEAEMDRTDLLVVPSLWPEPFGSVGPRAGAHGVPVAAFDVGGVRDWLTPGVNGYLAPGNPASASGLAHAIAQCFASEPEYARLRAGAVTLARRFNIDTHARALLDVLEETARRSNAQPLA